jgi:hypothetical protein
MIFAIFAGIIKKAQIRSIQNIFILIAIKIDKNTRKNKLYTFTFIHLDLAKSSLIIILKNLFQNIKKNKYKTSNNMVSINKSKPFMNNIDQNKKLFISKVTFHSNQITKIHQAIQVCDIISFVDSFVINLVFSTKKINKLQIIQNKNANK